MGKALRVLNVEDSDRDAALLTRHLSAAGYELTSECVETAETMKAALDANEWDVVLCDYKMPRFNALAALDVLRESGLDIPFIIISGTVGEEVAVEAMLAGAHDYLPKDNLTRLVPAIERELREAENRHKTLKAENERRVIFEIIQDSITTPNLEQFLKLIHRSIGQIVYAENCYVMLHDPASDMMHFEFWVDKYDPVPPPGPVGKGFSSYVLRTGQPLLLTDEARKKILKEGEVEQIGSASASWLGVPLRTPSKTIGVLVLQHYEDKHAYSQDDLEFLSSVGDQISLAIERKRTEEALSQSEELYRSVVETASDAIITIDETSTIIFANTAAENIFGYSIDEMTGSSLTMLMPEYLRHLHKTGIERYVETGHKHLSWDHIELPGLHRSGQEIPLELSFAEFTQHGRRYLTGLISDITERKQAEYALRDSEERYRDLVENALDIIYTHDLAGNYTSVNRAAEMITGYSREESLSMNLADTVAPEYLEKAMRMTAAKLAGEKVTAYELEIIAKDGHRVPVEVNTRVIYANDIAVGVQGIARDITERKQLEEQLRQSQKMESIGVLAGGIAHDFNNLLTAISGYSDLTLKKISPNDPLRRNIVEIKNAASRGAELTAQLLAFSRKQILKPRVHNLNSVVSNIKNMLCRVIRESIELQIVLDPDIGNIKADPGQIEQVIMNLAVNARDSMPEGGTLKIETQSTYVDKNRNGRNIMVEPGPFVKMTVSDTGQGMDEQTQRRIFEPFFTTKDVGKGTGLGLSTVHGIIKQSGGDITVDSKPGQGTTFEIYLPSVGEALQTRMWIEDSEENYSVTETILLVEDDEIVRNLVHDILTGKGYKVLAAGSGKAALTICGTFSEPIHILLTDMIMPNMNGSELRDEVIKLRPDIKILFMSGHTDDSNGQSGGFDLETAFIEKPFTTDGLARKVREVLELSRT